MRVFSHFIEWIKDLPLIFQNLYFDQTCVDDWRKIIFLFHYLLSPSSGDVVVQFYSVVCVLELISSTILAVFLLLMSIWHPWYTVYVKHRLLTLLSEICVVFSMFDLFCFCFFFRECRKCNAGKVNYFCSLPFPACCLYGSDVVKLWFCWVLYRGKESHTAFYTLQHYMFRCQVGSYSQQSLQRTTKFWSLGELQESCGL